MGKSRDRREYLKELHENMYMLKAELKENLPDISKAAGKTSYPSVTIMDEHYRTWVQRRKKSGRVKKRHLCKVDNPKLSYLHSLICLRFPVKAAPNVYSYIKDAKCTDCAAPHVGAFALYKLDISDFFYSITREAIEDMYFTHFTEEVNSLTYSMGLKKKDYLDSAREAARIIAIITTRSDPRKKNLEDAVLPIGTSPASMISNRILKPVDLELTQLSKKEGVVYTRYSDNMFFSASEHISREFQEKVQKVVEDYEIAGKKPFKINKDKTAYLARWRQQRILGIVVNEKMNISKGREKFMRSALNHLYHDMKQLYDAVSNETSDLKTLRKSYSAFYRRSDRIFGQLAYIYQIAPTKYLKYSTWQHAVKLLRDEIGMLLDTKEEEKVKTRSASV